MKITKQFYKKLARLRMKFPQLISLYPDLEQFHKAIKEIIEGYAVTYGSDRILNRFIHCYALNPQEFKSSQEFESEMKSRLADAVFEEFGKKETDKNYIQLYFDEVGKIYQENNEFKEELLFLPENREAFIHSNLKLVISTASQYKNLGVPLEDLIGAGNLGLCIAFEKFSSQRNTIRDNIIQDITDAQKEIWTKDDIIQVIGNYYTYGNILEKLSKKMPTRGFDKCENLITWIKENIKPAIFASVAYMWIRAYILIEINKNAHIVRIPKSETQSMPTRSRLVSLSEYTNNDNTDLDIKSDFYEKLEENTDVPLRQEQFIDVVQKLLSNLSARERRIVMKKFGIGLPCAMTIAEIAEDENISTSRCGGTYKEAMNKIIAVCNSGHYDKLIEQLKENL